MKYLVVLFLFILFTSCKPETPSSPTTTLAIPLKREKAKTPYIRPPTEKWEIVIPNQKVPEGLSSLSAEQCGVCHQKHFEEWKYSTHSRAWTDLQFQAEIKKETSPLMCINCHIPLQNQQEYLVSGFLDGDIYKPVKKKNPQFDPELQKEGINCASCHVRNNMIVGPTGTDKAPHKTIKDPAHLSEKLCITCHNAVAVITPTLACTFETGNEWKAGPYFDKKNCIDCHMPEVKREIVIGYGKRKSHFHYFAGSGIPKRKGALTKMLNGFTFFPTPLKKRYKKNQTLKFAITLKNENAGHRVPTGDPERFFLINFKLMDSKNKTLSEQEDRIGETWEWHPVAKKLSDNNVLPGKERTFHFSKKILKKGTYSLSVVVTKHRISDEAADYNKLGDIYPRYIPVFEKKYTFKVR